MLQLQKECPSVALQPACLAATEQQAPAHHCVQAMDSSRIEQDPGHCSQPVQKQRTKRRVAAAVRRNKNRKCNSSPAHECVSNGSSGQQHLSYVTVVLSFQHSKKKILHFSSN